ncbi:hypothetical protein BXZ70DRAFT_869315, partial [Cristinia sonorae]
MVTLFVKHVLRYGDERAGLFGKTSAYFGTVEEQGRSTLHLHLLVWIENSLSPQQIRDRLKDPSNNAEFERDLINWLEACHRGDFHSGTEQQVKARIRRKCQSNSDHISNNDNEPQQNELTNWYEAATEEADEIVYLSNRHSENYNRGCKKRPDDDCRARFPREIRQHTVVDREEGSVLMRKREPWFNTWNTFLALLERCNSDVVPILSSTLCRGVLAYITDYITKTGLKLHGMFEIILSVLDHKEELTKELPSNESAARRLFTRIVNTITAKQQVGGPMVMHEMSGRPDHYTSHEFRNIHWYSYVRKIALDTNTTISRKECNRDQEDESVTIQTTDSNIVPFSRIDDYIHRPDQFNRFSLYQYVTRTWSQRLTTSQAKHCDVQFGGGSYYSTASPPLITKVSFRFRPRHPLWASHGVFVIKDGVKVVPMYVGGKMPRRDHGDRELYCMTMLTLFAPGGWRHGRDLKHGHSTWDAAFRATRFEQYASEAMDHMNELYECYDARDDLA